MKHYGDVSKINGSKVEPVDVITFGSPCQDLSVAGKRAGIQDGERSNLFFEAIRIIKEMREVTNGEYPKYAVWENVPGAFSSNKGHDFKAVLEAFCAVCDDAVSIPEPYDTKRTKLVWNKSGEIVGDNYSIAWRTLDAQYWGVPQRRKRIYLVADFRGQCAREILFKPESLRGHTAQGNEAGQGVAADVVGCVDGSVGAVCGVTSGVQFTGDFDTTAKTLRARDYKEPMAVIYSFDSLSSNSMKSSNPNSGCRAVEVAKCIDTTYPDPSKNQGGVACYDARGNGDGETVLFEPRSPDGEPRVYSDICPTLNTAQGGQRQPCVVQNTLCFNEAQITSPTNGNNPQWDEPCHTMSATDNRAPTVIIKKPPRKYIIRRLTPTECARLQGFPDKWGHLAPYDPADADFWEQVRKTYAEINGKKYKPVKDLEKWYNKLHTDSAEYKAYGNGLALPNAEFVMRGIAEMLRNKKGQFESKGGVIEHNGYVCVYKPEHPRARANGYVRKHILVAEEMLNRPLNSEEVVHHINGDKTDNRPENLEVFATHAEHVKHHNHKDGKKYSYKGSEYTVAELSEFSVVDYSVLTQRINKLGWDIERAVETPKRGQPTLGSLFDGIGGFPLAGALNGIDPVWASEVELYPIAVTKSRFGGTLCD